MGNRHYSPLSAFRFPLWPPLSAFRFPLFVLLLVTSAPASRAVEHVSFTYQNRQIQLDGQVLVAAQDGGLLVLARDGSLWPLQPKEIVKHDGDAQPFAPFSADELSALVLKELPQGFAVHRTAHYLICYNTSPEYARWCGSLFEQLYRAFSSYWTHRGFTLSEPQFPLVAIVFADRASYMRFAQAEVGAAAQTIIGYFSLQTNRMTMCDLTGVEAVSRLRKRPVSTAAEINQVLAQPDAERTVATVVHEATHQIAFNCGLHCRFSDCTLWFSEGIAIFFETPDLSSSKGWRNVGGVNRPRLAEFRQYLHQRPRNSLETLLSDDRRFRDTAQALDAYAEAWALTYFLIRQKPKQYVDYLRLLSEKKPLAIDTPAARLQQFTRIFGDLRRLDGEFLHHMALVR